MEYSSRKRSQRRTIELELSNEEIRDHLTLVEKELEHLYFDFFASVQPSGAISLAKSVTLDWSGVSAIKADEDESKILGPINADCNFYNKKSNSHEWTRIAA